MLVTKVSKFGFVDAMGSYAEYFSTSALDLIYDLIEEGYLLPLVGGIDEHGDGEPVYEVDPVLINCACTEYTAEEFIEEFSYNYTVEDWKKDREADSSEYITALAEYMERECITHVLDNGNILVIE